MMCGFLFDGKDMYDLYGVKVESVSIGAIPPPRERKIEIPGRQGAYEIDWGDYAERQIAITCSSARNLSAPERRELAYVLSRRGQLVLPTDPAVYWLGRMYDPGEVEQAGYHLLRFTLSFTCYPFAYGNIVTASSDDEPIPLSYAATAPTPCRISITNTGPNTINSVVVTHVINREA